MVASIFWYDFETTGINPRADRPLQVAGIRTDLELNEIDDPINLYCTLSDDILPHPQACLVTGITPDILALKGLKEVEFFKKLEQQLSQPQTCTAGYNNIRFDDEVVRYGLYRNFYDPYAREWQAGNSRWDIIDLLRAAYALRPEGIVWPELEGQVSLKLELLTKENGIAHEQAHDALSDVRATIALARLVKEKQPQLYQYLFDLRLKREAQARIPLLKPIVHISGRFSAERHYMSIVLPLAKHPTNANAIIVCDLQKDISPLFDLSAEQIAQYLYTRHDDLPEDIPPIPLKLIHVNRCPVVAPLGVLRKQDVERLQLDVEFCLAQAEQLKVEQSTWYDKLVSVYRSDSISISDEIEDAEQQLYAGFLSVRDKRLCDAVRSLDPARLIDEMAHFEDGRLPTLLFRYRARNYPETLLNDEKKIWFDFCRQRLTDKKMGSPITIETFRQEAQQLLDTNHACEAILTAWQNHIEYLQEKYELNKN